MEYRCIITLKRRRTELAIPAGSLIVGRHQVKDIMMLAFVFCRPYMLCRYFTGVEELYLTIDIAPSIITPVSKETRTARSLYLNYRLGGL